MDSEFKVNSQQSLQKAVEAICAAWEEHKYITISFNTKKRRTITQNSAMHLYFRQLAEALNDAGLDQRKMLKRSVEMPWSEHSVKEFLWWPIQQAVTSKDSTARLNTKEVSMVYDVLNRHLAHKLGVVVAWPEVQDD